MADIIEEGNQGVAVSNRKTLGELLRETFDAYSMVGVKNITKLNLSIPWLPKANEKVITSNTTKKVSGREELSDDGMTTVPGKRKILNIGPDEVATISGEFAYVVIPYIINTAIQLEERQKKRIGTVDTGTETIKTTKERELRKRELLEEVFVGFPREGRSDAES